MNRPYADARHRRRRPAISSESGGIIRNHRPADALRNEEGVVLVGIRPQDNKRSSAPIYRGGVFGGDRAWMDCRRRSS
jgi:hypothetical protein